MGDLAGVGQVCEDLGQFELAVGRQLDSLSDRVDEPTQCDLAGGPAVVAFQKFLEGHSFVLVVARLGLGEDVVNGRQQVVAESAHALGSSLPDLDEIVHKDVGVTEWALVGAVGRWRPFVWVHVWGVPIDDPRNGGQGQIGRVIFFLPVAWQPGRGEIVLCGAQGFQPVVGCWWLGLEPAVGQVADSF